jgi:uncharacterized protein YbjT (DUF2867 family)
MKVLLFGSTGLIGNLTLKNLIEDSRVDQIVIVTRKKSEIQHSKILKIVSSFEELNREVFLQSGVSHIDGALCALGTTIKKVKTKEAFRKVDLEYVIQSCDLAIELGAKHFGVISAEGASSNSPIFYSKTKGEMEEILMQKKISSLVILRPGLLLGERKESRPMEKLFIIVTPILNNLLHGSLKKYRGIEASKVAYFLTQSLFESNFGTKIIDNLKMLS